LRRLIVILLALFVLLIAAVNQPLTVGTEVTDNVADNVTCMSGNITAFKSVDEIRQYVRYTGIQCIRYSKDFDCDDFARLLVKQAKEDGREIGLLIIYENKWGKPRVHMKCFAVAGNYVYQIEPQNGNVQPLGGWEVRVD